MDTASTDIPTVPLRGGARIPQLGFGVFQVPPAETEETVARALAAGYRHIDTAAAYRNEAQAVGQAVRASGLERAEVFVTTKCWNDHHGYAQAKDALHASLRAPGLDYVDLYLIHWPVPAHDRYVETWKAFIELRDEGLVRVDRRLELPARAPRARDRRRPGETPASTRSSCTPPAAAGPAARARAARHRHRGVEPAGAGPVLGEQAIERIASEHARTPAQVVIRWHLQLGNVVIPKSVTPARIEREPRRVRLRARRGRDAAIEALDRGRRTGPDPTRSSALRQARGSTQPPGRAPRQGPPVAPASARSSSTTSPCRRTSAISSSGVAPWVMIATVPPRRRVSSGIPATGWTSSEEPMHSSTRPARTARRRAAARPRRAARRTAPRRA